MRIIVTKQDKEMYSCYSDNIGHVEDMSFKDISELLHALGCDNTDSRAILTVAESTGSAVIDILDDQQHEVHTTNYYVTLPIVDPSAIGTEYRPLTVLYLGKKADGDARTEVLVFWTESNIEVYHKVFTDEESALAKYNDVRDRMQSIYDMLGSDMYSDAFEKSKDLLDELALENSTEGTD